MTMVYLIYSRGQKTKRLISIVQPMKSQPMFSFRFRDTEICLFSISQVYVYQDILRQRIGCVNV